MGKGPYRPPVCAWAAPARWRPRAPARRRYAAAAMAEPSKAVLISGCSSGIGRATALRLAGSGWQVYASARRPESIADLADAGCRTLALDVTDDASMRAAVDAVEQESEAVGVLINNAGYSQSGAIDTVALSPRGLQRHGLDRAAQDRGAGRRAAPVRDQCLRPR